MKKFSVPCDFNGARSPFTIYIGSPKQDRHPIFFQSDWLSKERGGTIPQEVMESLTKLKELSEKNGVPFEDLCVYALGTAQQEATDENNVNEGDLGGEESDEVYITEGKQAEDEVGEDEIGEHEISEDEVGEDEIGENEISEDEIGENEISEDEVGEDEVGEDEIGEDEVGEDEIGEDEELTDEELEEIGDEVLKTGGDNSTSDVKTRSIDDTVVGSEDKIAEVSQPVKDTQGKETKITSPPSSNDKIDTVDEKAVKNEDGSLKKNESHESITEIKPTITKENGKDQSVEDIDDVSSTNESNQEVKGIKTAGTKQDLKKDVASKDISKKDAEPDANTLQSEDKKTSEE